MCTTDKRLNWAGMKLNRSCGCVDQSDAELPAHGWCYRCHVDLKQPTVDFRRVFILEIALDLARYFFQKFKVGWWRVCNLDQLSPRLAEYLPSN